MMALIRCQECGHEISTSAKSCPKCGAKQRRTGVLPRLAIGIAGAAVLMFAIAVANDTPEARQRTHDRDVIGACWEDQKRKSLDPGSQRFVAGVCEKLEREFRQRHGRNP
jgi:hypothetical protein